MSQRAGSRGVGVVAALALLAVGFVAGCAAEATETASDEAQAGRFSCNSPPAGDCSFYTRCLEASHPCGPRGYAITYGKRYCEAFGRLTTLSPEGRRWRDATMHCLQVRLASVLGRQDLTCTQITDHAFDDHPFCYTRPGSSICDLAPGDWLVVVRTIDAADLLSRRGRRQISATAAECLRMWTAPRPLASDPGALSGVGSAAAQSEREALARALVRDPDVDFATLEALVSADASPEPSLQRSSR